MTKRDYYIKVSEIIRTAIISMKLADEEIASLEEKVERTSFIYRKPIQEELETVKGERETIRKECIATVKNISDSFIYDAEADEAMRGECVSCDISLLNAGIDIPAKELEYMARRNANNSTMSRIILEYIKNNNVDASTETMATLNKAAHPNANAIQTAKDFHIVAGYMLKNEMYNKNDVFEQIVGKNSAAYAEFIGENEGGGHNGN